MKERAKLIEDLARLDRPISIVADELESFPWDCESELYTLTFTDIRYVLEKYLRREIDEPTLIEWADLLEGREDLGYEEGSERELAQILFELSSPEINREITPELIHILIAEIDGEAEPGTGGNAS